MTSKTNPVMEQDAPNFHHHPTKHFPLFLSCEELLRQGTSHQSLEDCALVMKKKYTSKKDAWMCGFLN